VIKKIALLAIAIFAVSFFSLGAVSAQAPIFEDVCDASTADSPACSDELGGNPISGQDGVLVRVVNILSYMVGVASVVMVMIGGLKYISANGDSNSIATAKNTILYALIGVAVFAVSQAIVLFVLRRL
jgi:hypothetical protein